MVLFNKYFYNIFVVISISIILRIFFINEYSDVNLDNEWGTLFYNLKYKGILSYRTLNDVSIPTVYMPPLYLYYIFIIDLFINGKEQYLPQAIVISQIIISGISIYLFYKINLFFFSKKISLLSSYILSFFPLYVYANLQISSISIQIFLSLLFLFLILKIMRRKKNLMTILILGFVSGLSLLLRGEFILIFFFSLFFLKYLKFSNFKEILIIFIISMITISPYLVRNYVNFKKITITKSFGYNLWKGNNIDATVEGSESLLAFQTGSIDKKIKNLQINNLYDFNYDKIFLDYSVESIKDNPILFVKRYIKKFLSLTFFNIKSNYPNYYNLLNFVPLVALSILFSLSIIFVFKKDTIYNYLILKLFFTIAIFSIFFILPRYKLIILPLQLIIINFFVAKLLSKKKGV